MAWYGAIQQVVNELINGVFAWVETPGPPVLRDINQLAQAGEAFAVLKGRPPRYICSVAPHTHNSRTGFVRKEVVARVGDEPTIGFVHFLVSYNAPATTSLQLNPADPHLETAATVLA